MHPEDFIAAVNSQLAAHGFEPFRTRVGGRSVLLGRQSEFRLRWFAVRLLTFVVVSAFDSEAATPDFLSQFLDDARQYAEKNYSGWPPLGIQGAVAAVTVAVVPAASEEARAWAVSPHGRRFAAVPYPVLVDLSRADVVHPRRMLLGGIFAGYLREIVEDNIGPALSGTE
jgi:hypothetical protein